MFILGISAFYHDSAACLIREGKIIAAAQEERFTRQKHDASFPRYAVSFCLSKAGITIADVDIVAFYEKPFIKFERLLLTYLTFAPWGLRSFLKAMPVWLKEKLVMKSVIARELDYQGEIVFPEHHESHAASAFFPSPFNEAAVVTLDGVGEWTTTSVGVGEGNRLELRQELHFPHSLGLLYSAFTYYIGFRVNSGEYKLMGLAPYGRPVYADLIKKELIDIKEDGSFRLNLKYFDYCVGLTMTNHRFHHMFGGPPRIPESPITQRAMDIACSIQVVVEEIILKIVRHAKQVTGQRFLCLAGGVALNCVANGKILKESLFDKIWVQPAAGDAGGALGAALAAWHVYLGQPRPVKDECHDGQQGSFLGPDIDDEQVKGLAQHKGWIYENISPRDLPKHVAKLLNEGKVIGLCQGRMEFGPRALGSRSIIADARSPRMQSILNLKIKFRESFRPFAPAVLKEKCQEYFDMDQESPYMLLVAPVKQSQRFSDKEGEGLLGIDQLKIKRSTIPAVTHVDYSARVQTVSKEENPLLYRIIEAFDQLTGTPVIINTSFNIRGEPIVCSVEDAYRCFMCTEIDFLLVGHYLFERKRQMHQERYHKADIMRTWD